MRSFSIGILFAAPLATAVSAQPKINTNGVVNVASYAIPGMPNAPIAQGSVFVIFGSGMGPATLQQVTQFPVPTTLGGTSVTISAGGQTLQAPVIYTLAGQVAAILPSNTPTGSATVTVAFNGATSAPQTIQVVTSSFGTFAVNQQGNGAGVITDVNYQIFLANSAARPGDAAIIWGTGLGPVTFSDAGQPQAINLNVPVQLYVGGKTVNTVYQGRSGCCAGLDQIVFTVPGGVEGCSVPVVVRINNIVSNTTTMPITSNSNRICYDSTGISSTDLQALLGKSSFSLGGVTLSRITSTNPLPPPLGGTTTIDSGGASFFSFTPSTFAGATGTFQQAALNTCIVTVFSGSSASIPGNLVGLDAGPVINVSGPKGQKQLPKVPQFTGIYSGQLSSGTPPAPVTTYLDPGPYAINNGSGGTDVKGFSFTMTVPPLLTWTNMSAVSASPIDRSKGVPVTWSGGDPGTFVTITGTSLVTGPPSIVASFTCIAPAP